MTEAMFARQAYDGILNFNSIKRLKRAIELIIAIAKDKEAINFKTNQKFKFKVNFITLTLPCPQDNITDKVLKSQVLDVWFKAAKRRFNLQSYVWRAERQKNGNLHFHLITDCFIQYEELRNSWNNRLNRLGFVDRYTEKHRGLSKEDYLLWYPPNAKNSIEKRCKAYLYGVATKWESPNTTDVHSIKKVRDLAAYMVKYMCKLDKKEQRINGKVWDCSKNLKRKDSCEFIIDFDTGEMINRAIKEVRCRSKTNDSCSLVFYNDAQFKQVVKNQHLKAYEEWIDSIRPAKLVV